MERPTTGRSGELWRRDDDDIVRNESAVNERNSGRPQTRIERPVSRRGLQSASHRRAPPSGSAYSHNRVTTGNSRINTMSSTASLSRINTGLPSTAQMSINVMDRPITQQGIAGLRPGTTRGLAMTRQIQDKRYYEGLVQLKIRELTQEIGTISREIEAQKKERATFLHYDNRAKQLAAELTEFQGQLADYNIVVDKMTSNVGKESMEEETREMAMENDRTYAEIQRFFEQRRFKEQQLRDVVEKIEREQKNAERIVETMDSVDREKYDKLNEEKARLEIEIGKFQREIDLLSGQRASLEEEIALSQVKQEAVKLRVKLQEVEAKRERLEEERKNKLSPEEERERFLVKVKQDNMDIAAAQRRITDAEREIGQLEQELEQLETDLEDGNSEKQIKYRELRKREEAIQQFMPNFERNRKEEMEKLENLEENVVEKLERLSYAIDDRTRLTPAEEMALVEIRNTEESNSIADRSFEGLTKEHAKLQQTLGKMETLEKRLKAELEELNAKIKDRENEITILQDLEGLKARSEIEHKQLLVDKDELTKRQPICRDELAMVRNEYEEMKKRLDKNETYLQITALEGKLDKLKDNNKIIESEIKETRNRIDYLPLKERAFTLLARYNTALGETVKSVY